MERVANENSHFLQITWTFFLQVSNDKGVKLLFNFKLSEIRIHAHFLYRRVLHVELK